MAEDRYGLAPLRELRERGEIARRGNLANAVGDAHVSAAAVANARERTEHARAAVVAAYRSREALRTAAELQRASDELLRTEHAHEERTDQGDQARAQLARWSSRRRRTRN